MLTYKKWKKINENFGVNLGVKTPGKIGELHSKWDEMGMSMPMMKKSKKMFGGDDGPDMGAGPDAHLGGGDEEGGDAPPFMKKKGKGKKPPFPPHGGDDMGGDHDDLDADMDGDDMGHDDDDMGDDDMGDDDMGDDDMGDDDMGDDDMGDDDMGDDDMGDDAGPGPGVGGPDGPMSGGDDDDDAVPAPALKGKKGGNFIDKTKSVADGAKMMHKGASKMIKGMKEGTKRKKMTKEESEFWRSLQSQTGATKFGKDTDGSWNPVSEDAVIPPSDPNANIQDDEPGPGDPGYAPQGRVGGIGSFSEWSSKYQRKSKINESKKRK